MIPGLGNHRASDGPGFLQRAESSITIDRPVHSEPNQANCPAQLTMRLHEMSLPRSLAPDLRWPTACSWRIIDRQFSQPENKAEQNADLRRKKIPHRRELSIWT